MNIPTDEYLRQYWRSQGGEFFGPNIETGFMAEALLLPLLRKLLDISPNVPKRERPQKAPDKSGAQYIRELVTYCGLTQSATGDIAPSRHLEFLLEQLADAKDDALRLHHAYVDLKFRDEEGRDKLLVHQPQGPVRGYTGSGSIHGAAKGRALADSEVAPKEKPAGEQCAQWNRSNPSGTEVVVTKDSGKEVATRTRSAAFVSTSGHPAIFLVGITGYYLLESVRVAPAPKTEEQTHE